MGRCRQARNHTELHPSSARTPASEAARVSSVTDAAGDSGDTGDTGDRRTGMTIWRRRCAGSGARGGRRSLTTRARDRRPADRSGRRRGRYLGHVVRCRPCRAGPAGLRDRAGAPSRYGRASVHVGSSPRPLVNTARSRATRRRDAGDGSRRAASRARHLGEISALRRHRSAWRVVERLPGATSARHGPMSLAARQAPAFAIEHRRRHGSHIAVSAERQILEGGIQGELALMYRARTPPFYRRMPVAKDGTNLVISMLDYAPACIAPA